MKGLLNSLLAALAVCILAGACGHTYLTASRMHDAGMTRRAIRLLEEAGADGRFAENASFQYGFGMMYLDEGRTEYYTLQGLRTTPTRPGIYIRRQGARAEKVVVR